MNVISSFFKISTFQHNLTITVADGSCPARTHPVTVVVYKVLLQEYIFNKPMYKYEISEDQTVPHLVDCFKNLFNHTGVYRLKYTNSTCFSLSSTGTLLLTLFEDKSLFHSVVKSFCCQNFKKLKVYTNKYQCDFPNVYSILKNMLLNLFFCFCY